MGKKSAVPMSKGCRSFGGISNYPPNRINIDKNNKVILVKKINKKKLFFNQKHSLGKSKKKETPKY